MNRWWSLAPPVAALAGALADVMNRWWSLAPPVAALAGALADVGDATAPREACSLAVHCSPPEKRELDSYTVNYNTAILPRACKRELNSYTVNYYTAILPRACNRIRQQSHIIYIQLSSTIVKRMLIMTTLKYL